MKRTVALFLCGSLAVTACSSQTAVVADPPSFALSLSDATITQGTSLTLNLYLSTTHQFSAPVTVGITGQPSGINLTYASSVNLATEAFDKITVAVDQAVPPGRYPLNIVGEGGGLTRTTTAAITVVAPGAAGSSPPTPAPVPPTPVYNSPSFPHGFSPPCTSPYLIKGNLSSTGERIYHLPGGAYYSRTIPEVCFITEGDAQADGFRRSSR
jgi:hypothetical protein